MTTGEIGPDIVEMAEKAGISRIFYKPFNIIELLAAVRHFSFEDATYVKIAGCG